MKMKRIFGIVFCMLISQQAWAETTQASAVSPAAPPAATTLSQKFDQHLDRIFKARTFDQERLKVKLGGQSRYRFELRDDFTLNDATYEDDAINMLRNRLNLDINWAPAPEVPSIRVFAEGQEAHSFAESDVNQNNTFVNEIDLRQLFVELKSPWKELPLTAKAGRQVLSYGDERFVGGLEWTNTARVFDAVKLVLNPYAWLQVDAFVSQVVRVEPEGADKTVHDDLFYGFYAATKPIVDHVLDTFLFIRHNSDKSVAGERTGERGELKEYTFGNRFKGKKWNFDYGTEYAVQLGSRAHDQIAAWAFHQEIGYTFVKLPWTPRIYGEYNHASGDRNPTDGVSSTFDQLFPTNHNKYGHIDIVGYRNINNWMVGAGVKPHPRVIFSADFHWFTLDAKESGWFGEGGGVNRAANANADTDLGQEIDLWASYKFSEHLSFAAGYSHFFAGPFMEDTGRSDDANLFYIQNILNF